MTKPNRQDAWGHLKIIERGFDPVTAKGPNGLYPTGEDGPQWWILACRCGFCWKFYVRSFPGRAKMRSCGRAECSVGNLPSGAGRPPLPEGERGHSYQVYMRPSLWERLRVYAVKEQISVSGLLSGIVVDALAELDQISTEKKKQVQIESGAAISSDRSIVSG